MSNPQFVFLNRSDVPASDSLQAAIDRLGFKLTSHREFTPFEDSGFSGCVLAG